jgi:hypothetical protein
MGQLTFPVDFAMSVYSEAISYNCKAVECMQSDDYDRAAALLSTAMKSLIATIRQCSSSDSAPTSFKESDCQIQNFISPIYTVCLPCFEGEEMSVSPDNYFEVYNRAFILRDHFGCGTITAENDALASACMLYNMGLLHHRYAVKTGRTSKLEKALKFYEMALMTLNHQARISEMESIDNLVLALCNNVGHIKSLFFDRAGAQSCSAYIQEALRAMETDITLCCDDLEFFYMTTLLGNINLSLAPAA